jgi:aspartate kinase
MNAGRVPVGGVQVYRDLGMISILGTPHGPGMAGEVLETLGEAGINVEFISCCPDSGGGDDIVVCVARARIDEALAILEPVRPRIRPVGMKVTSGLVGLAIFGPHFREIPAVAGRVFRALADAGVNILAISTSVSSVTSVFEEARLEDALAALRERFDIGS